MNDHAPYTPVSVDVKTTPRYSGVIPLLTVLRDSRYIGQEAMRHSAVDKIEEQLAALRAVEDWWLSEGMKHFTGAPYAIFAVRAALGHRQLEENK